MANDNKKEIKIEVPNDIASGTYANFAVIAHSANEFYIDFVSVSSQHATGTCSKSNYHDS